MELTLYSNCRLTKGYNEVFQASYLEGYLDTLTSVTFTIEGVYLTNKGNLPLDMMVDGVYQYNYFKLYDDVNDITRYFFIDDLSIVNGTCLIEYSEDMWSSYSSMISIVRGNLSNLRYGTSGMLPRLPNEYVSNNALTITQLNQGASIMRHRVYPVVQLSFYNLAESGKPTYRFFKTFVLSKYSSSNQPLSISTALEYVLGLNDQTAETGSLTWNVQEESGFTFDAFEILNVYFVPFNIAPSWTIKYYGSNVDAYIESESLTTKTTIYLNEIEPNSELISNYTLSPNYKHYALGTLDNLIAVDNDNKTINYSVIYSIQDSFFSITLKCGTNIVDITNSFIVAIPVSVQTADVTQQQAIARQLKNNQIELSNQETLDKTKLSYIKSGINAVSGIASLGGGIATGNVGASIGGATSLMGTGLDVASTMLSTQYTLARNDLELWALNQESYKTSNIIKVNDNKILTWFYGLVYFDVVPDNETYINNLIDTIGYKVQAIVTNDTLITTAQENKTYNIIRFDNLWLTGNLPHNTLEELKAILMKGFKIYFTSNV